MLNKKIFTILPAALLCLTAVSFGANLANPAAQIPDARLAIGASYFLGGSTITNMEIPMMTNRAGARVSYAPIRYVNFGVDFGTAQISVDQYTYGRGDTIPVFDGRFGWFAGGHLKVSSPFFADRVSVFGLANGNFFRSENKQHAYYGGKEGVGIVGAQLRIPRFGYVSVGPHVYLIMGENRAYDGKVTGITGTYSNIYNVRGWIAVDYFPEAEIFNFWGGQKPYASMEFTMSPKVGGSTKRVPIQEFSISVSVGVITQRLYGADREAEEL